MLLIRLLPETFGIRRTRRLGIIPPSLATEKGSRLALRFIPLILSHHFRHVHFIASEKKLEFNLSINPSNTVAEGDGYSIHKISLYLMNNAIEFTKRYRNRIYRYLFKMKLYNSFLSDDGVPKSRDKEGRRSYGK